MQKRTGQVDPWLLITIIGLLSFGVIMITSIGVPKSIALSAPDVLYPNCTLPEVDCYLLLKNHILRLILGILAMTFGILMPYKFWEKISLPVYALSVGLLGVVLFMGASFNTFAKSWLAIPIIGSLQPAEIAKIALIFYFAVWLSKRKTQEQLDSFKGGFLSFILISGLVILPVILQPDLGSTLVLASIAVVMYFVAGARVSHLAVGLIIGLIFSAITVTQVDYLGNRFKAFLQPNADCSESYCWQTEQAKIAIGSGGFWGKGLTKGVQKSYWLPQASDDFIFAASAEEIGFLRTLLVIFAYSLIAYRGYKVALSSTDPFATLLATGITTWVSVQAFLNIAVNISLFPITGITLPLVSYGGSSLVTTLFALGILLNISKSINNNAPNSYRRRNSRPRKSQYRYSGRA